MKYSIEVSSAPPAEPLTLPEAKLHLKVDVTDDDDLITGLIQAAREWVENYCRRSLVQQTRVLRLDCWQPEIRLPGEPVQSVSSVQYLDASSNAQTLATAQYQVDLYSVPPRIVPAPGVIWPVLPFQKINSVSVTYVSGYAPGDASPTDYAENIPAGIRAAMKLLLGHWYDTRAAVIAANVPPTEVPLGVKHLLAPFEVRDYTLE